MSSQHSSRSDAAGGEVIGPVERRRPDAEVGATLGEPLRLGERRAEARVRVVMAGKVFRRASQRYAAARTCDVSSGGALLEVEMPGGVGVGEIVDVAVVTDAAGGGGAVVSRGAMVPAVVVRVGGVEHGRQRVAVRYVRAAREAMTTRRAA